MGLPCCISLSGHVHSCHKPGNTGYSGKSKFVALDVFFFIILEGGDRFELCCFSVKGQLEVSLTKNASFCSYVLVPCYLSIGSKNVTLAVL